MSEPKEMAAGRLSKAEMDFIKKNIRELGVEVVAEKLRRPLPTVAKYATSQGIAFDDSIPQEKVDAVAITNELRSSPEWIALKDEFLENELEYFAHRFGKLKAQFKDDVIASEESQIFQMIKFEILMQRNLKANKRGMYEIRRVEKQLASLYVQFSDKPMDQQTQSNVLTMENQVLGMRSGAGARNAEYVKLQEKYSAIMKELKATRDQRISRIENIKESFTDLIKGLQDDDLRQREDRQMQLAKMSMDKEYQRLGDYHTYADGNVDQPILSADTVKDD